jgi:hypothetical protein
MSSIQPNFQISKIIYHLDTVSNQRLREIAKCQKSRLESPMFPRDGNTWESEFLAMFLIYDFEKKCKALF